MSNLHVIKIHLAASQINRKTFNNAIHLVLPVVMMTVGVHNGSDGPLFYPEEELRRSAHLWDGKPVLVNHPMNGSTPVSANNIEVWEGQVLGQIWNSRFEENRLKAEIWLHEDRTRTIAPGLLDLLCRGVNIDVSTGLFCSDDYTSGEWHGERYTAIARQHIPDHLAILPDQRGACSWADGCGIRNEANQQQNSFDATFPAYFRSFVRKGGLSMMHKEEPLGLPTLNAPPKVKETTVHNEMKADEYDMDFEKLWRTI